MHICIQTTELAISKKFIFILILILRSIVCQMRCILWAARHCSFGIVGDNLVNENGNENQHEKVYSKTQQMHHKSIDVNH